MYENEEYENREENLYHEESREDSLDNDEISAEEEGFMKGYDEATEEKEDEEKEDEEKDED